MRNYKKLPRAAAPILGILFCLFTTIGHAAGIKLLQIPADASGPAIKYRVVDKTGNTIDFLLRAHRDKVAARRYFEKAIAQNGEPETVTIDKSGSNLAALQALNVERETPIRIRQKKYLNNVIEQDHRAIKRRTRPMLGFKSFRCARIILGGIEFMHMIVKGQMKDGGIALTPAQQFYSLAA